MEVNAKRRHAFFSPVNILSRAECEWVKCDTCTRKNCVCVRRVRCTVYRLLRLLLLCFPLTLQRDLGWWLWGCESFEKYSISVLRSHSINAISWHCCVRDGCKWFCLPPCALDLIFFKKINCILIAFQICLTVFFEEQCKQNYEVLFPSLDRMDSGLCRRLIVGPCHFLFLPELHHSPKWIENSTKFPCGGCALSNCREQAFNSSNLDSLGYHQCVLEQLA